jgi:hypothetical protein
VHHHGKIPTCEDFWLLCEFTNCLQGSPLRILHGCPFVEDLVLMTRLRFLLAVKHGFYDGIFDMASRISNGLEK